mgnify:CR=1 FL=1
MKKIRRRYIILFIIFIIILTGFLIPQHFVNPVLNATQKDYNQKSFWFYPWGKSGVHKGVDIFAKEGTPVLSASGGLVVYQGYLSRGGNVILILGPKWRLHYYAHLQTMDVNIFSLTGFKEKIGTVGTTGNAQGKPPHLHYSIISLFPYWWRKDNDRLGWLKMFYLNPIDYLNITGIN